MSKPDTMKGFLFRITLLVVCGSAPMLQAEDYNALILETLKRMPEGGGYSVSSSASERFRAAVANHGDDLEVNARIATPSYCSSATYLLLLEVLDQLHERKEIRMTPETITALTAMRQADGHGIWGRWNANGPGAAALFDDLGLGRNFIGFENARKGDFIKMFWTDAVGKHERGHLAVYLGMIRGEEEPEVVFWSSNQPGGYGRKSVPLSKIARAIFSRLEHPANINRAPTLPERDPYLASLLSTVSSFEEARREVGAR